MLFDELWFRFWEYWHCENFVIGLDEYVHDACGKSLLACVNFFLWSWQNFVGKFVGMKTFWTWKKILWVWNFDLWKNFVGFMMLTLGKFVWLWFWLCEILFVHGHELVGDFYGYLRHVGIFCAWLWKNLVVVYGCVEDSDCGKILAGHWFLIIFWLDGFWLWDFFDMWVQSWKIFGHVILRHGNFLSCEFFVGMGIDELNFCVTEL